MKRFILGVSICLLYSSVSFGLSGSHGVGTPYFEFGNSGSLSSTGFALSTAMVHNVTGSALAVRFNSPVTQISAPATFYAFLQSEFGNPSSIVATVNNIYAFGGDDDRPDANGIPLSTSSVVDVNGVAANSWVAFSFSSVTFTAGMTYWIILKNTTPSPAVNYPTFLAGGLNSYTTIRFQAFTSTSGFQGVDPAATSSEGAMVIKFADGSVMGNPYTIATSSSNIKDKGMRFNFDGDVEIAGVLAYAAPASTMSLNIYQGSTLISSASIDRSVINNGGAIYLPNPVTFFAGINYDVMFDVAVGSSTFSTRIDAGLNPPQDVLNCMFSGLSYVDGLTPGSYNSTPGIFTGMSLIINSFFPSKNIIYDSTLYDTTIY